MSLRLLALGSIVFTALGVGLVLYTDDVVIGWLCIAFFGFGGASAIAKQLLQQSIGKAGRSRRALRNNVNRQSTESTMGADSFMAYYGIKIPLDPDDETTLDACGSTAAVRHYWQRRTEAQRRRVRSRAVAALAVHGTVLTSRALSLTD